MSNDYGPSILLATLYEKTSAKGTRYFTGRLGAAKIAILPSKEAADDGTPMWKMLLSEAPAKQEGRPSNFARQQSQAPAPAPAARPGPSSARLDDEIPFAPEVR